LKREGRGKAQLKNGSIFIGKFSKDLMDEGDLYE